MHNPRKSQVELTVKKTGSKWPGMQRIVEEWRSVPRPYGAIFSCREKLTGVSRAEVVVLQMNPARATGKHRHAFEEIFVPLEGQARIVIEDSVSELGPGDVVSVPANQIHHVESGSMCGFCCLIVMSPPRDPEVVIRIDG
jgi:mannose-6-phosphate isomerase-like protein (cupin superfamily)